MILRTSIEALMRHQSLSREAIQACFAEILKPETNPLQIGAFLVLLRSKGETAEELLGLVEAMKANMLKVNSKHTLLDIVGTGGDGKNTINISSGSAILAVASGVKIAKHGNRAVSSQCGSADVLEALGVNIQMKLDKIQACLDQVGLAFCFSPNFHPSMSALKTIRRELKVPTTFNLLGPLLNPASPAHYLMGIYDESLMEVMAETLQKLKIQKSFIVHGEGTDEMTCLGKTKILEINETGIHSFEIHPEALGFKRCDLSDLQGADAAFNAQRLVAVFKEPQQYPGLRDTLILNAGAAIYLYGLSASLEAGLEKAEASLLAGQALDVLNRLKEMSHE